MRYGTRGIKVRELQQRLLSRGYVLPQYGADGVLGDETWDALKDFARHEGIKWDPEVPASVLIDALEAVPRTPAILTAPPPPDDPPMLIDLRDRPDPPSRVRGKMKWWVRNGAVVKRPVHTIKGITLHQTATPFGLSDAQVRAAGGDRRLALARRALNVACHFQAFVDDQGPFVAWAAPIPWYVWHGNGFNTETLGIEITGRFAGLESDPARTTWGGTAQPITDEIVAAGREAVRIATVEGRKAGAPIEYIVAHRQSSENRRSDPGEGLWKAVVLDYAVPVLGLITRPAHTVGSGKPIPRQWDERYGVGDY